MLTYSLGLMSGTSKDGIDCALLATDGLQQIQSLGHSHYAYDQATRSLLLETESALKQTAGDIQALPAGLYQAASDHSTQLHIKAVQQFLNQTDHQVDLIAYHGQTLYHQPQREISIQIGEPQLLADHYQMPVMFDFRSQDIRQGGQGAPLAPIYHLALAQKYHLIPCAIVNCGGIANVTLISSDRADDLIGFDTGPGTV